MTALDKKLFRDLWGMRGQALAIAAVMASGVATFVMSLSTLASLVYSQQAYYDRYRFAEVFAQLKRAPAALAEQVAEIPGVSQVQTRVVQDVNLDVAGLAEPAVGRLISVPEGRRPVLNDLYLRRGRYLEPSRSGEVLVTEAFADAHGFAPGDSVTAILNGKRKLLQIVGVVLSPEYVLNIRSAGIWPDDRRFGVFWMGQQELAAAFDMEGGFNDLCIGLMPGAPLAEVLRRIDRLIEPYGGLGSYAREDQVSHKYLTEEIRGLRGSVLVVPVIFLGVAAFLLNVVLSRLITLQRGEIGTLKAFGYSHREVGLHYLKLALLIAIVGSLVGTWTGARLGRGLTAIYAQFYRFPEYVFSVEAGLMMLGLVVSAVAAGVGVFGAVRRAANLPPATAMQPEPPADYRPTLVERLGFQRWLAQSSRMILRNLERQPLKALLSVFGIALAVAILVVGSFNEDALNHMMSFQFEREQREHLELAFFEPRGPGTIHELRSLPGVLHAEPARNVAAQIRFGHRSRRTAIIGLESADGLRRLLDVGERTVPLPPEGLVLAKKLAELLEVRVGDIVRVEVLEGERPVLELPVVQTIAKYWGITAYLQLDTLNRLLGEGPRISGAYLFVDDQRQDVLYRQLKQTPGVASVIVKQAALRSFHETVAENFLRMRVFNIVFACIIAFGVVYNSARISLSERSRELATLRVIGFRRREISMILLGELAVLVLVAIPLGFLIGYGLAALVTYAFDTELYRIPLVIERSTYGLAAVVIIAAALVSGLVVRRRLDHLDLVAVLKTRE